MSPGSRDLDAIRHERLARTLAAVAQAHPFYKARFRQAGIDAGNLSTLADLEQLPLTTKSDYIAAPQAFRLEHADLGPEFRMEERVLWDVAYTTGTTSGRPSPFYNTTHDMYAILDQARRSNEAEGLVAGDRVANLYPLAGFPTGAFLSVVRSTMIGGMPVVHGLTGGANSEFKVRNAVPEAVEIVRRFEPTVLWGVPSFLRRFLDVARASGARLPQVRLVLTSGEPVPPALREEMRDGLSALGAGSVAFRARYAFTEMQGGLVQCAEDAAPQNVCPDFYHFEVVDGDTGRALPEGETGMLAVTHLHRRGTVLLRYLVGDILALSRTPCPHCGRVGERIVTTPRRTGSLVKCRGMLVNTDVLVDILSTTDGLSDYQIVFAREERPGAMDELILRVELAAPGSSGNEGLADAIARAVHAAVSLRPRVVLEPRGTLYDPERSIKAKRVLDLRANEAQPAPPTGY